MNALLFILAIIIVVVLLRAFVFVSLSLSGLLGIIVIFAVLVLLVDYTTNRRR